MIPLQKHFLFVLALEFFLLVFIKNLKRGSSYSFTEKVFNGTTQTKRIGFFAALDFNFEVNATIEEVWTCGGSLITPKY